MEKIKFQISENNSDYFIINDKGKKIAFFLRNVNKRGYEIIPLFETKQKKIKATTLYSGIYQVKNLLSEVGIEVEVA